MITKEELERLYVKEKKSQVQIGIIFKCDRKNVDYYLKKYKIQKRSLAECKKDLKSKYDFVLEGYDGKKDFCKNVLQMINNGMLLNEVCEKLGVHRSYLGKILRENGVNLKNHNGQKKRHSALMKEKNPVTKGSRKDGVILKNALIAKKKIYEKSLNNVKNFDEYSKKARHFAYKQFKDEVYKNGLVIDHMFSIKDGFKNNVPINVISNKCNLRIVTKEENLSKRSKSIITKEDLYSWQQKDYK